MRRAGDVLATKECGNPLRCCEIAENLIIAGRYVIPDIVLSFATMLSKNCGRWCGYVMIFLKYFLQYGWIPAFLVNSFPTSGSTLEEMKPVQDHLDYTPIRDHTDSVNCLSLAYRINGSVASFATSSDDSNIYVYSARKWGLKAPVIVVCNIWWPVALIYTLTHRCCIDRR